MVCYSAVSAIYSILAYCSTLLRLYSYNSLLLPDSLLRSLASCSSFRSCSFSKASLALSPCSFWFMYSSLSLSAASPPTAFFLLLSYSEICLIILFCSSFSSRRESISLAWPVLSPLAATFSISRKENGSGLGLEKASFL